MPSSFDSESEMGQVKRKEGLAVRSNNYLRSLYTFVGLNTSQDEIKKGLLEAGTLLNGSELLCESTETIRDSNPANESTSKPLHEDSNPDNSIHSEYLVSKSLRRETRRPLPPFKISEHSVQLYSMPILQEGSFEVRFVEVFSRIHADDGSVLFPRKYIPELIKQGYCEKYDFIVLGKFFRHIAKHKSLYDSNERYTFSVCDQTLMVPEFFRRLESLASDNSFDLSRLCLDVDVGFLESDEKVFERFLLSAQKCGCSLAISMKTIPNIDLHSLSQLDLDYLKLSANCLDRINSKTDMKEEIRNLIFQCDDLNMPVVAENVDRQSLKDLVDTFGITRMQGYLVSPPVHIEWANFS